MEFSKNELKKSTLKKVGEFGIFLDIILGEGTYSKVYLTSKLSQGVSITDTFFATKTIDKNEINPNKRELFEERVYKEIFILQNLDHPNIVKLIDVRSTTNNFYLIFEYCKGGTLDDYRKKKPSNKLLELEALEIIKQIADAMNFCVSKNPPIIHRDLKPANFLLQDGKIKISDFGFARLVENNEVKLKLTNKIGFLFILFNCQKKIFILYHRLRIVHGS